MTFNFPVAKFVTNSIDEQMSHVVEEINEVLDAIQASAAPDGDAHVMEELMDLTHSLETLWRVKTRIEGSVAVDSLRRKVVVKNLRRGYYVGLSVGSTPEPV